MLLRKSKINLSLALLAILFNGFNTYSQTTPESSLYNWFDTIIGKENLGINNGPLHTNPYKTIGENNMYFIANKFSKGTVIYDSQPYYDVRLKYDIYRDQLALNPCGEPEYLGVNLIQDKIKSFSLNGKNFIKLNKDQSSLPEFTTGYYETNPIEENFIFYIKHHKDILKKINDEGLYYSFVENNQFYIDYKNTLYEVNSKKNIIKIFPEYKNKISEFYLTNRGIMKLDKNQFMKNLMIHINNFLTNKAN